MAYLTDLPSELIQDIVSMLIPIETSSRRCLHEEPSESLLVSMHQPLKKLSQACRFLRNLCFPYLFSALKANVQDISGFVAFVQGRVLVEKVESLVIYSMKSNTRALIDGSLGTEDSFNISTWPQVLSLLDQINPRSLTFVLPPAAYEELLPYKLNLKDTWAFNISYQVLHLEKSLDDMRSGSTAIPTATPNIFCSRTWSHMTFNEGSSIPAYSTYEYFHKNTPSLLSPQQNWSFPINISARLTSFDLIGVFPMGHMDLTCAFLYRIKSLRRLRTQLAPSVSNNIMDDSEALGKCQREDLWSAFESGYQILSSAIESAQSHGPLAQLEEFVALDYATFGLREMIDRSVALEPREWHFDDQGSWTRIRIGSSIRSDVAGNAA